MMAARGLTRPGLAGSGSRPFAIGFFGSTPWGRMGSSTARRPGVPRYSMTNKGARSSPWSRPVQSPRFMRSYVGGSSILRNGFLPNMAYRSPNRSSAANCARSVIESSQRGRAIMSMTRRLSRRLKKSPRPPGGHRGGQRQAPRAVVPRRSPHRPKKQDHTTLGRTRDAPLCAKRSENRLGLYLRRHLSRERQGGRSCPAILQHRGHGIASPGDRAGCGARRPRRIVRRPGWMARHGEAGSARKHDARPLSVENIWQYMRDNWLSNRIFAGYEDIVDHCCFNWNKLVERPWLIMSIGIRD